MRRLACALALAPAAAVAEGALSLAQVLESVRDFSPVIVAAQADVAAARGELLVAEGAFDPSLTARAKGTPVGGYEQATGELRFDQPLAPLGARLFAGWRIGRGDFAVYDGKLATNELGELAAGGALSILRNRDTDRRRTSLTKGEASLDATLAQFDQQLLDLSRLAAFRYWDWSAAGRRVAIAEDLLRIALDRDAWLGTRITAGDLPALDRIDNARAVEQRRQQVVAARRSRDLSAIELSLYLRNKSGEPVVAAPDRLPELVEPPPVVTEPLPLEASLARRPELRRLAAQERSAQAEAALAENQLSPTLDLTFGVSQDLGAAPDADPKRGKPVLEGGLVLDVPIQQRLLGGRVDATNAAVQKVDALARLARDRVRADLQDAASALDAARARLEAARRELGYAREVAAGERTRYEQGESNLVFVNLREQQAFETALREVDALVDLQKARVAWAAAQGLTALEVGVTPTPPARGP